jgi:hypothetical protein
MSLRVCSVLSLWSFKSGSMHVWKSGIAITLRIKDEIQF